MEKFKFEGQINLPVEQIDLYDVAGNYFLGKHINEEGPLFAENIEEKFGK